MTVVKWIYKVLSFMFGLWLGMFIMTNLFIIIWVASNSLEDFRWEKDIDLKIKELQYKKLLEDK